MVEKSNLHRTYISGLERGRRNVSVINILRLARALNPRRAICSIIYGADRSTHVAVQLEGITPTEYGQLSDLLGAALQREQLATRQAIELCDKANPSDLWVHLIYHPFRNRFGRSDQSWKRVSGQALEHFLAAIYQPRLFDACNHIATDDFKIDTSRPADLQLPRTE